MKVKLVEGFPRRYFMIYIDGVQFQFQFLQAGHVQFEPNARRGC